MSTVVCISLGISPVLCTIRPKFIKLFYYIKVPACSGLHYSTLPLTGALKWGTVWTSVSIGRETKKGQSLKLHIYLIKTIYIQFWPILVSMTNDIEVHAVPHLKAPVNGKVEC